MIMVRRICILILLLSLPVFAQTGKQVNAQNLTEAEIKEAERIFATFKKRLEDTNDLRIALRGIPSDDWYKHFVINRVSALSDILPDNTNFILRNKQAHKQFYLRLLVFSRSYGLYYWSISKNESDDESEKKALASLLEGLPARQNKAIQDSLHALSSDLRFTNIKQVIKLSSSFQTAIPIVNKKLRRLRVERPQDFHKGLDFLSSFNSEEALTITCDEHCDGFPVGTNYLSKTIGGYVLRVGRVKHRIGVLGIELLAQ